MHICTFSGAIGAILAAMLDPKQRHKLLTADRTKDVSWVRAAIEHLMAADPDVSLDEIEDVLRARRRHGLPDRYRRGIRGCDRLCGLAPRARRGRHDGGIRTGWRWRCQSPRLNCGSRARPAANALHKMHFRRVWRDVEALVAGLAENVPADTDARFEVETMALQSGHCPALSAITMRIRSGS